MVDELLYILWDPDVVAFRLGSFAVRWYSLCWLIGLAAAYFIVRWLYDREKIPRKTFEPLFVYCFLGVLIGARLGHCLFYEPAYFLSSGYHFIEMLLPIHFLPHGGVRFTGYEGLASHGGTIGLIIGMWLYCRRYKVPVVLVFDFIGLCTGVTAACIRIGNLMNSEIIGKATEVPWAFVFAQVDSLPRHPSQLYEAIAYLVFFAIGLWIYLRGRIKPGRGYYFGLCLTLIFIFRFIIEWTKMEQVDFEVGMPLNMGQLLSIPFIALGIYCMCRGRKAKEMSDT